MKDDDLQTLIKMTEEGYTDQEIADTLFYSYWHVRNTRRLLGIWKRRGGGKRDRRMQTEDLGNGTARDV